MLKTLPLQIPRRVKLREAPILKAGLEYLSYHHKVADVWRNNTGAVKIADRFIRFGRKGITDILGFSRQGKILAFEAKAPGEGATVEQEEFMGRVNAFGGVAGVFYCIEDLERLMRRA